MAVDRQLVPLALARVLRRAVVRRPGHFDYGVCCAGLGIGTHSTQQLPSTVEAASAST